MRRACIASSSRTARSSSISAATGTKGSIPRCSGCISRCRKAPIRMPCSPSSTRSSRASRGRRHGGRAARARRAWRPSPSGRSCRRSTARRSCSGEYEIFHGDWAKLFSAPDELERVTVEDVRAVAREVLESNRRTVGVLIPDPRSRGRAAEDHAELEDA